MSTWHGTATTSGTTWISKSSMCPSNSVMSGTTSHSTINRCSMWELILAAGIVRHLQCVDARTMFLAAFLKCPIISR